MNGPLNERRILEAPSPSSAAASVTMRANRRRDTTPELQLRSALHRRGLRFRVDRAIQTGNSRVRPDIVFVSRRLAVFVDGCFWHSCPVHGQQPRINSSYWSAKLEANRNRDRMDNKKLTNAGWTIMRIWEHESAEDSARAIETKVRGGS